MVEEPAEENDESGSDTGDTVTVAVQRPSDDDDEPTNSGPEAPDLVDIDGPDQPGESGAGAETEAVAIEGRVEVTSGRVTTLEAPGGNVAGIEILSDVANGHVTVNEDNSFALVLTETDYIGNQSFTYRATFDDGSTSTNTVNLKLVEGDQAAGWATGETHYVLATDENDKVIVETGENHVKVYVSGSNDALSLADIARAEDMNVNNVTGEWLADHGGYGHTEGTALAEDAAIALWGELNPRDSTSSNHLLFERGYEYTEFRDRDTLERGVSGEDELNPILIGAWGDGDKPYLENGFYQSNGGENVVVQDIHFDGFKWQGDGANVLLDNITVTGDPLELQRIDGITLRNSDITDVHLEQSRDGGDWDGSADRESGLFGNFNDGLLLENNLWDLNGWELGYDPGHDGNDGHPPSIYNHNVYLGDDNTDVTVRDNISARGASTGLLIRTGGFIEDNVTIDNNIGITNLGGNYKGAGHVDNYSLFNGNLVTSAGHKEAQYTTGRPYGLRDEGLDSTLIDNIVTHLANPDDPDEFAEKTLTQEGLITFDPYYDDTILFNWRGSDPTGRTTELNADHLDADILNDTTIQNFAAELLGQDNATIADLLEHLRAQEAGEIPVTVDNHTILRYFQDGFGIDADIRTEAQTLRFEPDDLGDGIRWDNRLNWDTEDLPGEIFVEDSVDLGGNNVVFGSNTAIDTLEIGEDGELRAYGGKLTVNGGIIGHGDAELNLNNAGQVWADGGHADELEITTDDSARFVNTGAFSGASLTARDGQAILASDNAEFDLEDGDVLEIHGDAKVGFDGEDGGLAILDLHEGATVLYGSDDGTLGEVGEFRSGAFGDTPDVLSGIDLGGAALEIELGGISAAQNGTTLQLMSADELIGVFDDAAISGLGGRNAEIIINYEDDTVKLALTNGSGNVSISTVGQEDDIDADSDALWAALTSGQGIANDFDDGRLDDDDDQADAA